MKPQGMNTSLPTTERALTMVLALAEAVEFSPEQATKICMALRADMTFDALLTVVSGAKLEPGERSKLRKLLRQRRPERGTACAKNHPGTPSRFATRSERRRNRKGEVFEYRSEYCVRCHASYKKPSVGATSICACTHRKGEHKDGECYHRDANRKYDCDCVKFREVSR